MPRTSQTRSDAETTTMPASQTQAGTRARRSRVRHPPRSTSASRRAISEASGVPARCRRRRRLRSPPAAPRRRPTRRRRPARTRRRTARRRGRGRARAPRARARPHPSRRGRRGARRAARARRRGRRPRRSPTGDLERDVVGELGEPAGVADDERLAERQRADRRARRLAHRRGAQADVDVARGHQRPQPLLVDPALPHDPVAVEPEPLQPPLEVEARRDRADEQQPRARVLGAARARTPRGAAARACSR